MDKKIKHLEMIQHVIDRMSGNLFYLKGWTITALIALLVFFFKENNGLCLFFSFMIVLVFWILDAYFLSLEKSYRGLYNSVRKKKETQIDFSLDYRPFQKDKNTWFRSFFSTTLVLFYGFWIFIILILSSWSKIKNLEINYFSGRKNVVESKFNQKLKVDDDYFLIIK